MLNQECCPPLQKAAAEAKKAKAAKKAKKGSKAEDAQPDVEGAAAANATSVRAPSSLLYLA